MKKDDSLRGMWRGADLKDEGSDDPDRSLASEAPRPRRREASNIDDGFDEDDHHPGGIDGRARDDPSFWGRAMGLFSHMMSPRAANEEAAVTAAAGPSSNEQTAENSDNEKIDGKPSYLRQRNVKDAETVAAEREKKTNEGTVSPLVFDSNRCQSHGDAKPTTVKKGRTRTKQVLPSRIAAASAKRMTQDRTSFARKRKSTPDSSCTKAPSIARKPIRHGPWSDYKVDDGSPAVANGDTAPKGAAAVAVAVRVTIPPLPRRRYIVRGPDPIPGRRHHAAIPPPIPVAVARTAPIAPLEIPQEPKKPKRAAKARSSTNKKRRGIDEDYKVASDEKSEAQPATAGVATRSRGQPRKDASPTLPQNLTTMMTKSEVAAKPQPVSDSAPASPSLSKSGQPLSCQEPENPLQNAGSLLPQLEDKSKKEAPARSGSNNDEEPPTKVKRGRGLHRTGALSPEAVASPPAGTAVPRRPERDGSRPKSKTDSDGAVRLPVPGHGRPRGAKTPLTKSKSKSVASLKSNVTSNVDDAHIADTAPSPKLPGGRPQEVETVAIDTQDAVQSAASDPAVSVADQNRTLPVGIVKDEIRKGEASPDKTHKEVANVIESPKSLSRCPDLPAEDTEDIEREQSSNSLSRHQGVRIETPTEGTTDTGTVKRNVKAHGSVSMPGAASSSKAAICPTENEPKQLVLNLKHDRPNAPTQIMGDGAFDLKQPDSVSLSATMEMSNIGIDEELKMSSMTVLAMKSDADLVQTSSFSTRGEYHLSGHSNVNENCEANQRSRRAAIGQQLNGTPVDAASETDAALRLPTPEDRNDPVTESTFEPKEDTVQSVESKLQSTSAADPPAATSDSRFEMPIMEEILETDKRISHSLQCLPSEGESGTIICGPRFAVESERLHARSTMQDDENFRRKASTVEKIETSNTSLPRQSTPDQDVSIELSVEPLALVAGSELVQRRPSLASQAVVPSELTLKPINERLDYLPYLSVGSQNSSERTSSESTRKFTTESSLAHSRREDDNRVVPIEEFTPVSASSGRIEQPSTFSTLPLRQNEEAEATRAATIERFLTSVKTATDARLADSSTRDENVRAVYQGISTESSENASEPGASPAASPEGQSDSRDLSSVGIPTGTDCNTEMSRARPLSAVEESSFEPAKVESTLSTLTSICSDNGPTGTTKITTGDSNPTQRSTKALAIPRSDIAAGENSSDALFDVKSVPSKSQCASPPENERHETSAIRSKSLELSLEDNDGPTAPRNDIEISERVHETLVDRLKSRTRSKVQPAYVVDLLWESGSSKDEDSDDEGEPRNSKKKRGKRRNSPSISTNLVNSFSPTDEPDHSTCELENEDQLLPGSSPTSNIQKPSAEERRKQLVKVCTGREIEGKRKRTLQKEDETPKKKRGQPTIHHSRDSEDTSVATRAEGVKRSKGGLFLASSQKETIGDEHETDTSHLCSASQSPLITKVLPQQRITKTEAPVVDRYAEAAQSLIERVIFKATTTVASALKDGPWPSPYRSLGREAITERWEVPGRHMLEAHDEHMTIVGASLMQYSRDVILPVFNATRKGVVDERRIAIGTFLLLREALLMNSESIFYPDEDLYSDSVGTDDQLTRATFVSRLLATSIILLAIGYFEEMNATATTLSDNAAVASLEELFLDAAEAYDYGADEFAQHLTPLGDFDEPVLLMGQKLDVEERVAWNLTANIQRSRHSILQQRLNGVYDVSGNGRTVAAISVPEVTSAHVTILEAQRN